MIKKIKDNFRTKIKFCGLTVYRFQHSPYKKEFLKGVFTVRKTTDVDGELKKYRLFGITFRTKKRLIRGNPYSNTLFPAASAPSFSRVAIIAEMSIPQCKLYRVDNRVRALESLGYTVMVSSWRDFSLSMTNLQTADFVIFYRVPYVDIVDSYYNEASRLGLKKYFDIDDMVFDRKIYGGYLDENNFPEKQKEDLLVGCDLYRKALENSDCFLCTTQKMMQVGRQIKNETYIIPNCIPYTLCKVSEDAKKYESDRIRIFYGSGSNTHDEDFKMCLKGIEYVLDNYKNVELWIHGYLDIGVFNESVRKKIFKVDYIDAADYYFSISEYDISVIPLKGDIFSECKSNIKYIESSMFMIPCVCSDRFEFNHIIENGENGFIANSFLEWRDSLVRLVEDKDLRIKIGKNAKRTVLDLYSREQNLLYTDNVLFHKKINRKKCILYVNIFYGYSSFGGATIVVEQIAEKMKEKYADYDIFVFTAHTDRSPGKMTRYEWNGIAVFSISVGGMGLEYKNVSVLRMFNTVLDSVKPDLVHFHCIQALGIGMLTLCHKKSIKYAVTMHDAWWCCPRQFMLDKKNHFCDQYKVNPAVCKERCDIENDFFYARKHEIFKALKHAERIWTPSRTFMKQIENNFMFADINVNTNGIVIPAPSTRKTDPAHIVFGFFGGKFEVKGYSLLRETFSELSERNWKLVLLDTQVKFGIDSKMKRDWKNSNVEIHPFVPHDEIYNFYARIDVLLFPSNWKESFGLMVREAIASNVFVICSDCGGPVEAVSHGENGLIFQRGNKEEFKKCLQYVFDNFDRIKAYKTKNFGDIISFDEQAAALHAEYEKIMVRDEQDIPSGNICIS